MPTTFSNRVLWCVPSVPNLKWDGGAGGGQGRATCVGAPTPDLIFGTTGGWSWEEATWAASAIATKLNLPITIMGGFPLNAGKGLGEGTLVVLSSEFFAHSAIQEMPARKDLKILVRVVMQPEEGDSAWIRIAESAPFVYSWCCIGSHEAKALREWLSRRGLPTRVSIAPLGAEPPAHVDFTPGKRSGIAYLGSAIPQKNVPICIRAAANLDVEIHLGLLYVPDTLSAAGLIRIGEVATQCKARLSIDQYGIQARSQLLSRVRAVVIASTGCDSQWLPGIEGRVHGAVAIANRSPTIIEANGDDLFYYDGTTAGLTEALRAVVLDDARWEAEARRQHSTVEKAGRTSQQVGGTLCRWVEEALGPR